MTCQPAAPAMDLAATVPVEVPELAELVLEAADSRASGFPLENRSYWSGLP